MDTLKISTSLSLPISFVTQTQAILAKKRTGKSYTASVQAEELLKAGQQIVVIDVTGAWWGLRSSSDGKRSGYPILVAGGEHGDIPLEEGAGEVMAEAIVADRFSCILDLSFFRKGQAHRFLAPFLETLYRRNRAALHLFADEADFYAPQKPFGDEARTLGAMNDVVRRGGVRGIGTTLITQRPAVLNKDVLTQCEVLTCLRIVHHRDIAAIKEWVDVHGDPAEAKKMIAELPSLPIGTAWVWSPGWPDVHGIFQRAKIRKRETFDSGATPKPGEAVVAPKVLAQVDVERLGAAIQKTAERAKENDPKQLKAELQRMRAEVEGLKATRPAERVEVPVLTDGQLEQLDGAVRSLAAIADGLTVAIARARQPAPAAPMPAPAPGQKPTRPEPRTTLLPARQTGSEGGPLGKAERAILTAAAQRHPSRSSRIQLSVLSGYSITSSSFANAIGALRSKGLLAGHGDDNVITGDGLAAVGPIAPTPTGRELAGWWAAKLVKAEREMLLCLVDAHPRSLSKEQVSRATGYSVTSSSFANALGRLRSLGLIEGRGELRASDTFFSN